MAVTLSPAAARRLSDLSAAGGAPVYLRVAVDGGGCSGFQYRLDLVPEAAADDTRIEAGGQAALIDPISLPYLLGSVIDYVDELAGAQFRIDNPNARSSCGCGVSFSL